MTDWIKKLDDFLKFNEHNILTHAGKISQQLAHEHAEREFEKYEVERRRIEAETPTSDFDQLVAASKEFKPSQSQKKLPSSPANSKKTKKRER